MIKVKRCHHLAVRADAKPQRNGEYYDFWGCYICPDCQQPIEVTSESQIRAEDCQPSFKVARWSMAGVGDYWKERQSDGGFRNRR